MGMEFTPQQKKVITLRGKNILVSAAAGSGKTAVLVERIVEMVCDEEHPVDIDRLLVVTFTNAAAAEMRERIGGAIAQRLRENPGCAHLQRQATLLHNALITTIDSLCLFFLKNHFHEIGLDPAFRVADEGEIRLLQKEVLAELFEDRFAQHDPAFTECVEFFCPGGKESVLEQHILNLSRYASAFPWPKEWLMARRSDYQAEKTEDLFAGEAGACFTAHIRRMLAGCLARYQEAVRICEQPDGPYMYGETLEQEKEQIEALMDDTPTGWEARFPAFAFGRLSSKKDETVDPAKREAVKKLRDSVKKVLEKLVKQFFATPFIQALDQAKACEEPVSMLLDLTMEFDRRMQEKKQEKKMIDFSDMEHYALDILLKWDGKDYVPSNVALEYRQHFAEVLIDEYQDSNLVQEKLLCAVSGEGQGVFNRFMVGDVKQSIYKFRLARPELFLEKYESYGESGDCVRIDLSQNFRSRIQVIDTVNAIFGKMMSRECGGIVYDEKAMLYAGASYPQTPDSGSELLLLEKPQGVSALAGKQQEALLVAERIKRLLREGKVTDKASGTLRAATYRDMVILLRTNSGWDQVFQEVLQQQGIPVSITSKTGYFAALEVQELLNFLRVLSNPLQDIPLFGVMKSLFGGFSDEEIAYIRAGNGQMPLYQALKSYPPEGGNYEKIQRFLDKLAAYRKAMVYLPIRQLLQRIVEEHDYLNYVTALPGGGQRRANVEMLFTKATDFEKTSYFGLFHFIRYMEQLEKYDVDYGQADTLDENADVVRIMSIHKSKGLEFPIVFVCGLAKKFNLQDTSQSMMTDVDLGIAVDYVDARNRLRNKTLRRQILSVKMREDTLAEELRVFYVALTRAREKLILTASLEQAAQKIQAVETQPDRRLTYLDFMEAGSCLEFLLPILGGTPLTVEIKTVEELQGEQIAEQLSLEEKRQRLARAGELADERMRDRLRERFARRYRHSALEGLYTKTTVSELKIAAMAEKDEAAYHTFEEREVIPYIPAFRREEESVSATARGNAYHRVMELMDFAEVFGGQFAQAPETYPAYREALDHKALLGRLESFLQRKAEEHLLTGEALQAVSRRKIAHFLESELGYRMWRAHCRGKLYREQPFVLALEASRMGGQFPKEETVLIQGIIDVFFEEADGLVLLDYKTDVIDSMEALWKRYEVQLAYYQEALERLVGKPVKEKLLYSFHLEQS